MPVAAAVAMTVACSEPGSGIGDQPGPGPFVPGPNDCTRTEQRDTWSTYTHPATCTEDGFTEERCSEGCAPRNRQILTAQGHSEFEHSRTGGCGEPGVIVWKCSVAGCDHEREESFYYTPHNFDYRSEEVITFSEWSEWEVRTAPTCSATGERYKTQTRTTTVNKFCSCGAPYEKNPIITTETLEELETIDKLEHNWEVVNDHGAPRWIGQWEAGQNGHPEGRDFEPGGKDMKCSHCQEVRNRVDSMTAQQYLINWLNNNTNITITAPPENATSDQIQAFLVSIETAITSYIREAEDNKDILYRYTITGMIDRPFWSGTSNSSSTTSIGMGFPRVNPLGATPNTINNAQTIGSIIFIHQFGLSVAELDPSRIELAAAFHVQALDKFTLNGSTPRMNFHELPVQLSLSYPAIAPHTMFDHLRDDKFAPFTQLISNDLLAFNQEMSQQEIINANGLVFYNNLSEVPPFRTRMEMLFYLHQNQNSGLRLSSFNARDTLAREERVYLNGKLLVPQLYLTTRAGLIERYNLDNPDFNNSFSMLLSGIIPNNNFEKIGL